MSINNTRNIEVSVLMLTYNQARYVDDALSSVLHQITDFDFEIVIGDDCSTDSTIKHIQKWIAQYPQQIRLLSAEKNQGLLPNFIRTFNSCKGKYIAICEGDDYWIDKQKLQMQYDFLERHPQYSTCIHRVVNFYEDNNTKSLSNGGQKAENNLLDLARSNFITNVSAFFRATRVNNLPEWFASVGTYDYALHMLNAADGDIYYMSKPMAVYRKHSGAIWSKSKISSQLQLSMQVREPLMKHFRNNTEAYSILKQAYLACYAALKKHYLANNQLAEISILEQRITNVLPEVDTKELEQICSTTTKGASKTKSSVRKLLKSIRSVVSRLIPTPKPA